MVGVRTAMCLQKLKHAFPGVLLSGLLAAGTAAGCHQAETQSSLNSPPAGAPIAPGHNGFGPTPLQEYDPQSSPYSEPVPLPGPLPGPTFGPGPDVGPEFSEPLQTPLESEQRFSPFPEAEATKPRLRDRVSEWFHPGRTQAPPESASRRVDPEPPGRASVSTSKSSRKNSRYKRQPLPTTTPVYQVVDGKQAEDTRPRPIIQRSNSDRFQHLTPLPRSSSFSGSEDGNRLSGPAAFPQSGSFTPTPLDSAEAELPPTGPALVPPTGPSVATPGGPGRLRVPGSAEPLRVRSPASEPLEEISVPGRSFSRSLQLSRLAICDEIRGYNDLSELDPQKLGPGQAILIYAAIDQFHSRATANGYRTVTVSTLEIRTREGLLVSKLPLGTANDLSQEPRQEFFLTHHLEIPTDLPVGDYVFRLSIADIFGQQEASRQLSVRVTGDRIPPGGTGGIAESAGLRATPRR